LLKIERRRYRTMMATGMSPPETGRRQQQEGVRVTTPLL
jgi:hypothetical protein